MPARDLDDPRSLIGTWRLARVIEDRLAGVQNRIDGHLELSAVAPGRIRWAETGRWHQAAGDLKVHRRLWVDHEEGAWCVRFEDGRDFHPWTPGSSVLHPCNPDTYTGLVQGTARRWTVRWDVLGPSKDYTMETVLTPIG